MLNFAFQSNELVQVETYLRQEGILVRYWYPLSVLERPIHHQMSAASTCNVDVKDCVVHRFVPSVCKQSISIITL